MTAGRTGAHCGCCWKPEGKIKAECPIVVYTLKSIEVQQARIKEGEFYRAFWRNWSICGKRLSAFMEPSGYFGCAVPHRYTDII